MLRRSATKTALSQKILLVIIGITLSLIILELSLHAGGFIFSSLQQRRNRIALRQKGAYRILCLGESTTAFGGEYSYPSQLQDILNQNSLGIKFSVINKGLAGANSCIILSKLEPYLDTYHPDMVITMMGINDFGPHIPNNPVYNSGVMNFLTSLRTYKLIRLLRLHIISKLREARSPVTKTGLQQSYTTEKHALLNKNLLEHKKALELNPNNIRAYVELGRIYRNQSKFPEAEEMIRKALKLIPGNSAAYVELGLSCQGQSKFSEAEDSFKKALELDPKNIRAYVALGRIYRSQSKFPEAEEMIRKALKLIPRNSAAYVELGLSCQGQSKFSEAEDSFKKALELDPRNIGVYLELGQLYKDQSKFPEAEEMIRKALELDPRNSMAYFALGLFYHWRDNLVQAEDSFKKALELDPSNIGAYLGLGKIYKDQTRFPEAEGSFKKALEFDPKNIRAYLEFGWLYEDQAKFSEAEGSFKKALELDPGNSGACFELGLFYRLQDNLSQAEDSFKKALELDSRNNEAYLELGRLYRDQARFPEAEELFKKALEADPKNSRAYYELGWIYRAQGKLTEAEQSLKRILEFDPMNDGIFAVPETLYAEMLNIEHAKKYRQNFDDLLRLNRYSPVTRDSYLKLKEILDSRGIAFTCVQYPARNIELLKRIFQGNNKGIIFVDNEETFKNAVARYGYLEYFRDNFAGDFGHCTLKGNRLLAENIAKAILKEVLEKTN